MKEYGNFDLTGKTAVVIGGTRGIGKALSLGLADAGADVSPVSRNEENSRKTAQEIRDKGRKALSCGVDATDYDNLSNFKDRFIEEYGHVDILVNCQGINNWGHILDIELEKWRRVIAVNLESVFMSMKIFGKEMVKRKKGKIINIASISSFEGIGGSPAYSASKGAVRQLTMVGAIEWATYNVQVNCIAPGWFPTDLAPIFNGSNPELAESIINKIPMGRTGKVEELIGACVYLSSEASNYVTGSTITVDGGFLSYGVGR